jgi:hypothetical protein
MKRKPRAPKKPSHAARSSLSYLRVCGHHLDVEVTPAKRGQTVDVSVALRWAQRHRRAGELRVELLGPHLEASERLLGPAPDELLSSLIWSGQLSLFRGDRFRLPAGRPLFVAVELEGHRGLAGPFLAEDDEGETDDDGGSDDGGDGDDGDDETGDGDDDSVKCCPTKFETPTGNLTTTIKPIDFMGVQLGWMVHAEPWIIKAAFSNRKNCLCACCEYRQSVKGSSTKTLANGQKISLAPVRDYAWTGLSPEGLTLRPLKRGPGDDFKEDTVGDPEQPGHPLAYGHRGDTHARIKLPNGDIEELCDDYPDPCSYYALDRPGGITVVAGNRVDVDLTFRGEIIDVCQENAVVERKEWTWKYQHAF